MTEASVFITGATGFLGGALSRRLLSEGHAIVASGRRADALRELSELGAHIVQADLSRPVEDSFPPCELMVHCAALSSPWGRMVDFERANVLGTQNAIRLARKLGVKRLVHISTPSLYFRFADQHQIKEDGPLPKPINAYAETKARAEEFVLSATDLDPIILRPRGLYGAGDVALLPRLFRAAVKRPLPLMRGGQAATDLTHVDDVVSAIIASLEQAAQPSRRVFNISGGVALPIVGVVNAACARAGIAARWRKVPFALVRAYASVSETLSQLHPARPEPPITAYGTGLFAFQQTLDISNAKAELGWVPQISFEEGLERTFGREARA